MSELDQKLDSFIQIILKDAQAEREATLQELKQQWNERINAIEIQLLTEAYHYIQDEISALRAEAGRSISKNLMEDRKKVSEAREKIAHEVFDAVRIKIREFTKSPDYTAHMEQLFLHAFQALGSPHDAVVFLRPEDLSMQQSLAALMPASYIEFKEGSFSLGGLILDCHSKMQRADVSFDTALSDLNGHFAELIGLSLSDDE